LETVSAHHVDHGGNDPSGSEAIPAGNPAGRAAAVSGPVEALLAADALPVDSSALGAADRVTYRVRQRFRYTYDGPARDLVHRLVAVPPSRHGDQVCRLASVAASAPGALTTWSRNPDGAREATVRLAEVPRELEFDVSFVVDRFTGHGPAHLPATALTGRRLLAPTALTEPGDLLRPVARALARADPLETARRICSWVHRRISYAGGSTDVTTSAEQAVAGGSGVCQDYAHVMIAMCRAVGVPARYVSGHMLGEGASHAWVEVIVPDGPAARSVRALALGAADPPVRASAGAGGSHAWASPPGGAGACAVAFDPCHDRLADLGYVTVAVGRDYHDVAPTSGRYVGSGRGTLDTVQRVDIIDVVGPA
jgi:transglutaminase-like putative cysteine protease